MKWMLVHKMLCRFVMLTENIVMNRNICLQFYDGKDRFSKSFDRQETVWVSIKICQKLS